MSKYFAEIDKTKTVLRVIIADSIDWCIENLGGNWVETADPYADTKTELEYCGKGFKYDDQHPAKFAIDASKLTEYLPNQKLFLGGRIVTTDSEAKIISLDVVKGEKIA